MIIEKNKKEKIVKITAIALVAVIIAGFIFSYFKKQSDEKKSMKNEENNQREAAYKGAKNALNDLNVSAAIEGYEKIASSTADKEIKAIMKTKIGYTYLTQAQETRKGMEFLRDVAADRTLSRQRRAEALLAMAGSWLIDRNQEKSREVFQELEKRKDVFGGLIANWNSNDFESSKQFFLKDLSEAANKELETSLADYRIAQWHGTKILDNPSMSKSEQESNLSQVKNNISRGDQLLDQLKDDDSLQYDDSVIRWLERSTRRIQMRDYLILARFDDSFKEKAIEKYKEIISSYAGYLSNNMKIGASYVFFNYASYLANTEGEAAKDKIKSVMAPIADTQSWAQSNSLGIWKMFDEEMKRPIAERDHTYASIVKLASLDEDFKNFLAGRGWKF